jgi:hypothetical protein
MKRKISITDSLLPTKKLKTIDNYQKIKDLRNTLDFDKPYNDLKLKLSALDTEKKAYITSYYLNKLYNKEIDYIFLNNDKNIDRTKFNVTDVAYCIEYTATFTFTPLGEGIYDGNLEHYTLGKLGLLLDLSEKNLHTNVQPQDYDELLKLSCFDREDVRTSIREIAWYKVQDMVVKDYIKDCKVCGEIIRHYYLVERK